MSLFQQKEVHLDPEELPEVPDDLFAHLAQLYPPVDPQPSDTPADLMYRAGAYSVIKHLYSLRQN
jgi:hypothetical protein